MSKQEIRHYVCVNCPVGCDLEVTVTDGVATQVSGNACKRGIAYGLDEATDPKRTVTSLVRVTGREMPLSVRTESPVPKKLIPECIAALREIDVTPPINIGDIILENICNTGVNVIATKEIN